MDRGLRERVRWGNVARAVAVVGVVVLVVAWPVVAPEGPRVPRSVAVPAATPAPTAVARPAAPVPRAVAPPVVRRPERRVVRGERRAGEGGGSAVRPRPAPVAPVVPAASPVARPAPRAAPPAPPASRLPAPADPDPVLREFGPESG